MRLLMRSLPTLSIATQQLGRLQAINLAKNNVTGAVGCDNAGPALQELDMSNAGCAWYLETRHIEPIQLCCIHLPIKLRRSRNLTSSTTGELAANSSKSVHWVHAARRVNQR